MDSRKNLLIAVIGLCLLAGCTAGGNGKLQVLNGFGEPVSSQHQGIYPDYRASVQSYWAYGVDSPSQVVWKTATVLERNPTTFVFTGSMGEPAGKADLYVNGTKALTFDLGANFASRSWEGVGVHLQFVRKVLNAGNSGLFYLSLPKSKINRGEPVELRVVVSEGAGGSWFMVKGYRDTVEYEKLTPETVPQMTPVG
jgi:hypothetical protein